MEYEEFLYILKEIMVEDYPVIHKVNEKGFINFCCPFHEDNNPSFGINYKTGGWKCFSGCGQGDFEDFVAKYKNISKIEASKIIISKNINFNPIKDINSELKIKNYKEYEEILFLKGFKEMVFDFSIYENNYKFIKDYWENRGLDEELYIIFECKIYYNSYKNNIAFYCDRGVMIKHIKGDWQWIKGSDKQTSLWKIIRGSDKVILCEGIFDALSLAVLYPELDIIAILGNNISDYKMKFIDRYYDNIVLAFDNDEGGKIAIEGFKEGYKKLMKNKRKKIFKLEYEGKDPNELLLNKGNFLIKKF